MLGGAYVGGHAWAGGVAGGHVCVAGGMHGKGSMHGEGGACVVCMPPWVSYYEIWSVNAQAVLHFGFKLHFP